jgi:hypothetical protein
MKKLLTSLKSLLVVPVLALAFATVVPVATTYAANEKCPDSGIAGGVTAGATSKLLSEVRSFFMINSSILSLY